MLYDTYDPYLCQGEGPLTYAGRRRSTVEHHHRGRQVLDIHLLKAELQEALALDSHGLPMVCVDDATGAAPEWVTYEFSTAHPILRWLPSKLAEWLAEIMLDELAIPAKQGAWYTVAHLNNILANNLVPNRDGGHLRTFMTLQREHDDYRGLPKARCYPFDLDGHRFCWQNPQVCYTICYVLVHIMLRIILYNMIYNFMLYTMLGNMLYTNTHSMLCNTIHTVLHIVLYNMIYECMLYMMLCNMLYTNKHIMLCNTIHTVLPSLTQLWQYCVCLIAPDPNNPNPADQFDFATDMDLSCYCLLWYARPQLFFRCTVARTGRLRDTASHQQLTLIYFSTF